MTATLESFLHWFATRAQLQDKLRQARSDLLTLSTQAAELAIEVDAHRRFCRAADKCPGRQEHLRLAQRVHYLEASEDNRRGRDPHKASLTLVPLEVEP